MINWSYNSQVHKEKEKIDTFLLSNRFIIFLITKSYVEFVQVIRYQHFSDDVYLSPQKIAVTDIANIYRVVVVKSRIHKYVVGILTHFLIYFILLWKFQVYAV